MSDSTDLGPLRWSKRRRHVPPRTPVTRSTEVTSEAAILGAKPEGPILGSSAFVGDHCPDGAPMELRRSRRSAAHKANSMSSSHQGSPRSTKNGHDLDLQWSSDTDGDEDPSASHRPLIWAQCDRCGKWRSLAHCRTEAELPKEWNCGMHPESFLADCRAPEEHFVRDEGVGDDGEVPSQYGLDCLFHIFHWLSLRDLCIVHCVCKSWRRAASHPLLWKHVRFDRVPPHMWPSMLSRMAKFGTVAWDLRGARLDLLWAIQSCSQTLPTLKHLWLPDGTPFSAVDVFTSEVANLETLLVDGFNESSSSSDSLNFGEFARLKNLRSLQLRAPLGWALPAFSFAGGTETLSELTNLRVLELTGVTNASPADFIFIRDLTHLHTLALGDCGLWDAGMYGALSGLTSLVRLRLDMLVEDAANPSLAHCLKPLSRLKRLDLFAVEAYDLENALATMQNLTTVVLVPYSEDAGRIAAVNTACIDAVVGADQLEDVRVSFIGAESSQQIAYGDDYVTASALRHSFKGPNRRNVSVCCSADKSTFSSANFLEECKLHKAFD